MYKKTISLIVGTLFISIGVLFYYNSPPSRMQDEIFFIKRGETLRGVAKRLKRLNLITDDNFFTILAIASKKTNVIKGKYKITEGMSSLEILTRLSNGDILRRRLMIPEGFNLYSIAERLSASEITDSDEFLRYSFNREFLKSIGIDSPSVEGYLFPDTYIFAEGQDARAIIKTMHNRLKGILDSFDLSNLKKQNFNIHQLLILASLIEKEAKIPSERGAISAVFHNRMKRGMKLGSCATVLYATRKFKGRIRYRDLRVDSPFNTYIHKGLPPTPICSPGEKSIRAALNPPSIGYLYFVSRNDGSHYFSKNLKEHNRAVDYYQKGIDNGFTDKQRL